MTYKKSLVNNNWYMSFGDFLTLILCFFLVLVSSSFNKKPNDIEKVNNDKTVLYTVKDNDISFKLPVSFYENMKLTKLDNSLLSKEIENVYLLKIPNKTYKNDVSQFVELLKSLSLSNEYDFKVLNYKNFDSFKDFLAIKHKLYDENIDVSELKMSKNNENEIILRFYKKI